MKCLNKFFITAVFIFISIGINAQINNSKTEKVTVYGNCEMCKTTIEKAGFKKNISKVVWDKDTKVTTITYDSSKISLDKVLKKIARAGYDNDLHKANDLSYEGLHVCCKYERKKD